MKEQQAKKLEQEVSNLKQEMTKDFIMSDSKNTSIDKEKESKGGKTLKDKNKDKTESFKKFSTRICNEKQQKHARYWRRSVVLKGQF